MGVTIKIGDRELPFRSNMGASLRFKQETGKEINEISQNSLSEVCTYLWCCVKAGCAVEGVEFNYSLMEFADRLDTESLTAWAQSITEAGGSVETEKKI